MIWLHEVKGSLQVLQYKSDQQNWYYLWIPRNLTKSSARACSPCARRLFFKSFTLFKWSSWFWICSWKSKNRCIVQDKAGLSSVTLLLITCATHIRDAKFLVRACPWITLPSPWHTSPLVVCILNGGSPTCLWKDTAWLRGKVNGLEGFSCRAFRDVYGEKDLTFISPWYDMSQHHLLNLLECYHQCE